MFQLIKSLIWLKNASPICITDKVTTILKQLMINAEKNVGKTNSQKRHSLVLKKFSTLLLINAGSMAYEFIHKNMPEALPSLRTVQSIIYKEYEHIREGQFRFDELLQHLKKHKAPYVVTIAEDATRIVKNVEYDALSNTCVGFVLPNGKYGIPILNSFIVTSFDDRKLLCH